MAAFIAPIAGLLERLIPDKAQRDAATAELARMSLNGELQTVLAQIDVNKAEAASGHDGWRRATGWVCVFALGYQFLFRTIGTWIAGMFHYTMAAPSLDMESLMMILLGMLGIGVHQGLTDGNWNPFSRGGK